MNRIEHLVFESFGVRFLVFGIVDVVVVLVASLLLQAGGQVGRFEVRQLGDVFEKLFGRAESSRIDRVRLESGCCGGRRGRLL